MTEKTTWAAVTIAAALMLVFAPGATVEASDGDRTLSGEYVWTNGNSRGDLEAVFTPTGERAWDVEFHFTFRGRAHTYSGTAKGSLEEGELEGRVQNEGKRRTFTFRGAFDDGIFRGDHWEVGEGGEYRTGTLELQG